MVERGTAHGKKIQEINCCLYGVPLPSVYKGGEERADQGEEARPRGESNSHRE